MTNFQLISVHTSMRRLTWTILNYLSVSIEYSSTHWNVYLLDTVIQVCFSCWGAGFFSPMETNQILYRKEVSKAYFLDLIKVCNIGKWKFYLGSMPYQVQTQLEDFLVNQRCQLQILSVSRFL